LFALLVMSTQVPLHDVCPAGHWHCVPLHTPPTGHVTQAPPQRVPVLHEIPHALPVHVAAPAPADGPGHARHAPPLTPVPHSVVDWAAEATHPVGSQHPFAQLVALHATHAPPEQISPVPHDLPSSMWLVGAHTGPLEHDHVPPMHGRPGGEHAPLTMHVAHVPWPSQTPVGTLAVVHDVPAEAATPLSVQVGTPPVHAVTEPVSQGLPAGEHEAPTVHALQTPP
jgi:hypothetical protein